MKRPRLSILWLMAAIVLISLGFAALRKPTILWASLIFTVAVAFSATAILGAMAGQGRVRIGWAGVAVFGWAYLVMSFGPFPNGNGVTCPPFPTQVLNDYLKNVRESAEKALSIQHPAWGLMRVDSRPAAETVLNAPRRAGWVAVPSAGPIGFVATPPSGTPPAPTVPYYDGLNLRRIGHALGAILFSLLGGLVGLVIAGRDVRDQPSGGG